MKRGREIGRRRHCSSLSHICNCFQLIYTRTHLLGLCWGQVYLDNSNSFLFDHLLKSILVVISLIETQFFYPHFTNLLYWVCWAWTHLFYRKSVWTQSLQLASFVGRTCVLVSATIRHGKIKSTSGKLAPSKFPTDRTHKVPATR